MIDACVSASFAAGYASSKLSIPVIDTSVASAFSSSGSFIQSGGISSGSRVVGSRGNDLMVSDLISSFNV